MKKLNFNYWTFATELRTVAKKKWFGQARSNTELLTNYEKFFFFQILSTIANWQVIVALLIPQVRITFWNKPKKYIFVTWPKVEDSGLPARDPGPWVEAGGVGGGVLDLGTSCPRGRAFDCGCGICRGGTVARRGAHADLRLAHGVQLHQQRKGLDQASA